MPDRSPSGTSGKRPQGLKGTKLEVDSLFITTYEQHVNDLISTIEGLGVYVEDVIASPLAASFVMLSKAQKRAGCVLTNIGAETTSIVIFEDSTPISLKIFPVGSTDVTNDIALGLRIPLEDAEKIKRGAMTSATFSKKKLDEIIQERLRTIFTLIDKPFEIRPVLDSKLTTVLQIITVCLFFAPAALQKLQPLRDYFVALGWTVT